MTGGAGFIRSAVVRHLLDHTGAYVVNIDKLTYAANLASVPQGPGHPRYSFAKVDICNTSGLRELFDQHQTGLPRMNLAAESHVDRSIDRPGEFIQTNIVGTFMLLQEALRYWRGLEAGRRAAFRLLHVSTDEVFGTLGPERSVHREHGLRAELALFGKQSVIRSSRACVVPDL